MENRIQKYVEDRKAKFDRYQFSRRNRACWEECIFKATHVLNGIIRKTVSQFSHSTKLYTSEGATFSNRTGTTCHSSSAIKL